MAFKMIFWN